MQIETTRFNHQVEADELIEMLISDLFCSID